MDPIQALLQGVVLPGAVALVLVALLRKVSPAAPALGLAAGYAVAFALLLGFPALPPVDVTQVSPWVALAAAGLAFLSKDKGRVLGTALLGVALGVFLALPLYADDPGMLALTAGLVALSLVVLERGLDRALSRSEPRGGALAAIVLVSGAALAVLFSDIASLAQATGALAAAAGALFALGLFVPAAADIRRASPVLAGVMLTNLWSATLYANGRYEVLALIALAPLLAAFLRRPAKTLLAIAVPAALLALPVVLAAVLAGSRYLAEPEAPSQPAGAVAPADAPARGEQAYDPSYGY